VDGIDLIRPLTSETIAGVTFLPPRLAVLGATALAMELAQAFQRLGSAVTLVRPDGSDRLDPEFDEAILEELRRDGVEVRDRAEVSGLQPRGSEFVLTLSGRDSASVAATHLLVATGSAPFLESLGLDRAHVRCVAGRPVTSRNLRTSNNRIFAIGDVRGDRDDGPAAIATQVPILLRAAFFRQPTAYDPAVVPKTVRTTPPFAHVGLAEAEARTAGSVLNVLRSTFADHEHAIAIGQTSGHVKIVAGPRGRILGVSIFGFQAADLITPWSLALAQAIPLEAMAAVPTARPSLSEVSRRAALGYVTARLRQPWLRRIRGLVRLMG
jgi:pyruvate/2-oxoglutarate dehydrogenase complex dihydrolipoamide dehydrogenase (E3) component